MRPCRAPSRDCDRGKNLRARDTAVRANKYLPRARRRRFAALIVNLQIFARSLPSWLHKYLACTSMCISFHATFTLTLRIAGFIFSRSR